MEVINANKRTKAYKECVAEHGEDNIINAKDCADCLKAAEVARNHPIVKANGLLEGGEAEKEFYWDEKQGKAKAKIDYLKPDIFVEYKTTASIEKFQRTAEALHYHLGLAWYWRACGVPGVFVVQESKPPFDVAVFEVQELMLDGWLSKCLAIWDKYLDGCIDGAYNDPIMFEPRDDQDDFNVLDFGSEEE